MIFMIIVAPYWSAVTDAYIKDDYKWIKDSMRKLNLISIIFSIFILFMLLICNSIYYFWIGDIVMIPFELSISLALYNISIIFLSPYTHFINGFGKLALGVRIVFLKIILFLPLAIYLTKLFGSTGLVIGLIIINTLPNIIFSTIHYYKLVNKKAYGIWGK